jgi:hypothetical protein
MTNREIIRIYNLTSVKSLVELSGMTRSQLLDLVDSLPLVVALGAY